MNLDDEYSSKAAQQAQERATRRTQQAAPTIADAATALGARVQHTYQPGDRAWWQALKGRVRTPDAIPVRIVRKLRTRYEVQVLDFKDYGRDHASWEPTPAAAADLTPMKEITK